MHRLSIWPRWRRIHFQRPWGGLAHLQQDGIALNLRWSATGFSGNVRSLHASLARDARLPILLADIGEGVTEVEIIRWLIKSGQHIDEFDPICEVQSDKASVEITTRYTGTVEELAVGEGDIAKVGKPLCFINVKDDEVKVDQEAVIAARRSKPGLEERPEVQDVPAAESSSSAGAKEDGILFEDGPMTMSPLKKRDHRSRRPSLGPTAHPLSQGVVPSTLQAVLESRQKVGEPTKVLATPATRRLAKEMGIDLQGDVVHGSGPGGRVVKEDLERREKPEKGPAGSEEEVALTGVQKQMFKSMTQSLSIPHFVYSDEINVTRLAELRAACNKEVLQTSKAGSKMSFMPFMIKALALALDNHDLLRCRLKVTDGVPTLMKRDFVNVGIAMDTPSGLLVPVIQQVDTLSIVDIHQRLLDLQSRGQLGKLDAKDLGQSAKTAPTITLSNIGTVGGTYLHPVLPPSSLVIGAVGKIRRMPRYLEDDTSMVPVISPALVLCASFSADHRVVDGVTLARLVDRWKSFLENPAKMTMYLR